MSDIIEQPADVPPVDQPVEPAPPSERPTTVVTTYVPPDVGPTEPVCFTLPEFHIQSLQEHCVDVPEGFADAVRAIAPDEPIITMTDQSLPVVYQAITEETTIPYGYLVSTEWRGYRITADRVEFTIYAENLEHAQQQLLAITTTLVPHPT